MVQKIFPTYKIPKEAYFDESWLEQEKLNLFSKGWMYAGQASDVAESGNYITKKVGFNDLVIVRGKAGQLNAFHNVCRHRGAQLVQGTGKCGTFVCPYHKWSYSLDGNLKGITQANQFLEIDTGKLGLHKASVSVWMGLVFVNSDENPTVSLAEYLAGITDELDVFQAGELEVLKKESFTFEANWKFYIENHLDWLHLWYVHPKTLGNLEHEKGEFSQYGYHWISFDPVKSDQEEAFKAGNPLVELPQLSEVDEKHSQTGAHFIFPNLPVFTGSGFFAIAELVPLTPEKTQMNITLLGVPGGDVDVFLDLFNEITKGEDAAIIENIQLNVRSEHYRVGPIAHHYEKAISDFHDGYLRKMK